MNAYNLAIALSVMGHMESEEMEDEISPEIEMLARMWMLVDPNRYPADPEEIITMRNPEREVPHWHWFIPRAEGSLKHFQEAGYKLEKL